MPKTAIKLPDDYKKKALANKISLQTAYARIDRGWSLEDAVTVPPKKTKGSHLKNPRVKGMVTANPRPKGTRVYSFTIYQDLEDKLEQALANSELSNSDFLCKAVEEYLKNEEGKKEKQSKSPKGSRKNG